MDKGFFFTPISNEDIQSLRKAMDESIASEATKSFKLTAKQYQKFKEWNAEQTKIMEDQKMTSGACGGANSFTFTPTSLGMIITVENCITKQKIDLTEYDNF